MCFNAQLMLRRGHVFNTGLLLVILKNMVILQKNKKKSQQGCQSIIAHTCHILIQFQFTKVLESITTTQNITRCLMITKYFLFVTKREINSFECLV